VVQDLVPDDLHHLKRLQRRHAVDEHVAVDADEVLRVEDAVLVLAGRVDNLGRKLLPLVADLLAEGVLDGRVVALDKVPVDVADGEGGFAWVRETEALVGFDVPKVCQGNKHTD
jgi:hypothetical protein